MHPEVILKALRSRPFAPFRLHMLDGAVYDIRHPALLWITRRTAYLGIPDAVGSALPERAIMLTVAHISRLEELPAQASPGNGQPGGSDAPAA